MSADPLDALAPDEARRYAAHARRVAAAWTREDAAAWERDGRLPREVFAELGRAGLFRNRWEAGEVGGMRRGLALVAACSRTSASLGLAVGLHDESFIGALERPRSGTLARVRDLALDGSAVGCIASTEPEGGSDVARVRTSAHEHGNGWRIVGAKRYVTSGSTATHAIVTAAVVDGRGRRPTLFLVPLDLPGVTRAHRFGTVGLRGTDTAAIGLDVHVGDDHRVTAVGMGLVGLARALRRERLATCVQLTTGAADALALAAAFARSRASGPGRLMDRQAVRHRLAELTARLYAARALVATVVTEIESGQRCDAEVAMTKLTVARDVNRIADETLQVLGARGYSEDYPMERWWRDARLARLGGGADEALCDAIAHRLDVPDPDSDAWLDAIDRSIDHQLAYAGITPRSNPCPHDLTTTS